MPRRFYRINSIEGGCSIRISTSKMNIQRGFETIFHYERLKFCSKFCCNSLDSSLDLQFYLYKLNLGKILNISIFIQAIRFKDIEYLYRYMKFKVFIMMFL